MAQFTLLQALLNLTLSLSLHKTKSLRPDRPNEAAAACHG